MMKRSFIFLFASLLLCMAAVPFVTHADQCDPEDQNACGGSSSNQYCDPSTLTCKALSSAPVSTSGGSGTQVTDPTTGQTTTVIPGQTTTSGVSTANTNGNFYALTSLPFLQDISNAATVSPDDGLAAFFNSLYKICIGVAGAIAFFQIVRAGIMYMSAGDNTEKVSQARQLISTSILGLVIVLSPVIVFSIINPSILSLKVNFTNLAPANVPNGTPGSSSGAGINSTISVGDTGASCKGTATYSCSNPNASGSAGTAAVLPGNTCPSGYTLYTTCGTPAGSTPDVCSQYTGIEAITSDDYSGSGQAIDSNCCGSTLQAGYQCYGTKK